jgi:threonine dehydratase
MLTLADITGARERIQGVARHTPLIPSRTLPNVWYKAEMFQPIGSFKIRGAYNRLSVLLSQQPNTRGVIAFSSGNHAQGLAFAARELGVPAVIVMPNNTPGVKVDATRAYGAEVVLCEPSERVILAERLAKERGLTLVPPFNDLDVMAGQGTVGLEILEDLPAVETVIAPVGGGGLISGVGAALKHLKPAVKLFGVEPELAADAQASLRNGRIISISADETSKTVADGVRTTSVGDLTFPHIQQYVDDILTASEANIWKAARKLLLEEKLVIEPTSALTLAVYLAYPEQFPATVPTVLVLTGGSVEPGFLAQLLQEDQGVISGR